MNNSDIEGFADFVIENYGYKFSLNMSEVHEFITDFIYAIHNNEDFEISVRDAAKWLGANIWKINKTVYRSYKANIDYKEDKQYTSGRPRFDLYLSTDCFKSICLRSKSRRGEIIRRYFIFIENIYREYMTQSMYNRRRIDGENYSDKNYQKTNYAIGNCIYIIRILYNGVMSYKIGRTNDLNVRLGVHQRNFPGKIKLVLYDITLS